MPSSSQETREASLFRQGPVQGDDPGLFLVRLPPEPIRVAIEEQAQKGPPLR